MTDARHAVWNCYVRKPGATREGTLADARHTIRDCHARKPGATKESLIADARHAVTDCHARQTTAPIERIIADARHAAPDCHARKTSATTEGPIADARHAAPDCHALKSGATRKGPSSDARHGFCVIFGRNNKFFIGASADSRHCIAVSIAVQRICKTFTWATNPANYANAVFIIMFCKLAIFITTSFTYRLFGACCRTTCVAARRDFVLCLQYFSAF